MLSTLLTLILAGGGQSNGLPSEPLLCSLAEALLIWSPPVDGAGDGCVLPFAMGCGGRALFAGDGRPVVGLFYKGADKGSWAYPNDPCAARGLWLYKRGGRMPPGAHEMLKVDISRARPLEVWFTLTEGDANGTAGCGEFRGIARYKNGKWELVLTQPGPSRTQDNPSCQFTKEQVFHCNDGDRQRK
jgi:hypothetical protein